MPLKESLRDYLRGIAGGLLFSLPILLTREIWFTGFLAHPSRLLVGLLATLVLLVAFNTIAGLREGMSFGENVVEAVESFALGMVVAGTVFSVFGRFEPGNGWSVNASTLLVGTFAASIGVAVGTAQLGENPQDEENKEEAEDSFGRQMLTGVYGAMIVAANVAPTQEVVAVASEATPVQLLLLLGATLLLVAGVGGSGKLKGARPFSKLPPMEGPLFPVAATVVIAGAASAALLWFFGRYDGADAALAARQTIVLGAPASIGAVVGRALLQS